MGNEYSKAEFERRVFEIMYSNSDMEDGISRALALIGEEYGVSRVYIFENSANGMLCSNTFEWCAPGIEPQIDKLQNLSYTESGYDDVFSANEVFYCPDIYAVDNEPMVELLSSQGIYAVMQIALYDKGVMKGFIGFDDCSGPRPDWTDGSDSADILIYLSRLLSVYLLKERNLQSAAEFHEELRKSLISAREQSNARAEFLSSMSHEIRTPMNSIMGMAGLIKNEYSHEPKIVECMQQIEDSGEYLLEIINEVLEISRMDSVSNRLNYGWHRTDDVFLPAIRMIEPMMKEKGIHFEYDIAQFTDDKYEYYVDAQKTKQLFVNILSNAYKFTPAGGTVKMELEHVQDDPDKLESIDMVSVSDNGCGMTEEFLDSVFEPFKMERLPGNEHIRGTGLGLAISNSFVKKIGGYITVESELNRGSVFSVIYPHRYRRIDRSEDDAENENISCLAGKKILLADDKPMNLQILEKILASNGILCDTASDGAEAVEKFKSSRSGTYSAIIMDVVMPRLDGLQAAKMIRNLPNTDAKKIPIIALTGNAFGEDRRESIDAGMNDHLSKPVEPDVLIKTLARHIKN